MDFVKLSLSGFDEFLGYFGLSLAYLGVFLAIYVRITPYREIELIRNGNCAAAASLSGAVLGFVLPLASAMVNSVNPVDMALWAAIALVVQLLVYFLVRLLLPGINKHIPEGNVASGVFLGAMAIAAGILNAASMTY